VNFQQYYVEGLIVKMTKTLPKKAQIKSQPSLLINFLYTLLALTLSCFPSFTWASTNSSNIDTIIFGNTKSETAHHLQTCFGQISASSSPLPSEPSESAASDVVVGALNQTARRLLPRTPNADHYGGEAVFKMAVDPNKENNFTLKMWGGDSESKTWLVLNVDGLEVGARHHMKDETMLQNSNGWLPGRFIYRTVRLPQHLTANKTSVTIRIRSLGWISYYAPPPYDNFQKRMTSPSVGLYRAYTHTGVQPDINGEVQGQLPQIQTGSTTADEEAIWMSSFKAQINKMLDQRMAKTPENITSDDLDFLAQAYSVPWTSVANNPAVIEKVIQGFDAMVTAYSAAPETYLTQKFADHGGNGNWGGYFGQAGRAITLLWPQLQNRMQETAYYGGTLGQTSRKIAWANALRASINYGRTNRRTIGNQVTDSAQRTYWANAGLLLVDRDKALYEDEARRYIYEAYGLEPWMGNDASATDNGPIPERGNAPYGPDWFMVTSRGTTKEDCLVGGDYGEMGAQLFRLGQKLQDTRMIEQGLKMLRARAALRYPAADENGKLVAVVANPIGCRNDHQINRHKVYLANNFDTILVANAGAEVIGKDLLGFAQQQFNEGQLMTHISPSIASQLRGTAGKDEIVQVPDAYENFRRQSPTHVKLPMSIGQPDFAWVEDENMVVAAKRGEERFFANLYWRGPEAINRLARIFVTNPSTGYLAEISVDDVKFKPAGRNITLPKWVNMTPVPGGFAPPDNPINANVGLVRPQALRSDLTRAPAPWNRDAGRGTAYTLTYGNWLVAINAHPTETYQVKLPADFSSNKDLISGVWMKPELVLKPKQSVVFYLPDAQSDVTPPSDAIHCADERTLCVIPPDITATVWYGADKNWKLKKNIKAQIACNNTVFGDPNYGKPKSCRYKSESTAKPNEAPKVAITSPKTNHALIQGDLYNIQANASDADGKIVKVEFLYNGNNLLATTTQAPYQIAGSTTGVVTGAYSITARAYDDKGSVTTSAPIIINIKPPEANNKPPTVSITSPAKNTTLMQGDSYTITANATDSDGVISRIEFLYNGENLLAKSFKAPYTISGTTVGVATGQYSITARAYDNKGGVTTSAPVVITIKGK
jgi:hypothetical protein